MRERRKHLQYTLKDGNTFIAWCGRFINIDINEKVKGETCKSCKRSYNLYDEARIRHYEQRLSGIGVTW